MIERIDIHVSSRLVALCLLKKGKSKRLLLNHHHYDDFVFLLADRSTNFEDVHCVLSCYDTLVFVTITQYLTSLSFHLSTNTKPLALIKHNQHENLRTLKYEQHDKSRRHVSKGKPLSSPRPA